MPPPVEILLITGSPRAGATSTAVLQTVAEVVGPGTADPQMYFGTAALPHFNPDDDFAPLHPAVAELRALIAGADALLLSTPEYAGDLPGSFKNLLDWTVGGGEIVGKPTAWINTAAPGRADGAYAALRTVLGYTGADIVETACVRIPVARSAIDTETLTITDPDARAALAAAVTALIDHTRTRPR
ncbi:NAD(P)H-dependent oxidoreductase [Yinghuangia sp. ASG 101]|uniref:NADPH-dependent FMN reductase n=1 Tax=Yinghuangia sp. ASG 101 TaxID=2896848 RepID=UPI001E5B6890|nr:NADPH-dependent FMN reductase [Yinghuangia sp. ASG 101]UGQ08964.1 NAD(P)H-dependent oxidoreductase [Yinghuangia sp. ASG 101]